MYNILQVQEPFPTGGLTELFSFLRIFQDEAQRCPPPSAVEGCFNVCQLEGKKTTNNTDSVGTNCVKAVKLTALFSSNPLIDNWIYVASETTEDSFALSLTKQMSPV